MLYNRHCLLAYTVIVTLMQRVVVLSQYEVFVFVVMVQSLFVFGRFKRAKYIRSETINQINGHQHAVELESKVFYS